MPLSPDFRFGHYCAAQAARPLAICALSFYVNVKFCHADFTTFAGDAGCANAELDQKVGGSFHCFPLIRHPTFGPLSPAESNR
jgi:hypothetical protein